MSLPVLQLASTFAGRFIIESAPAAGGMSTVYRAIDFVRDRRLVALKLTSLDEPARRVMFERECLALERLSHPGTARHLDHGFAGDVAWLAMNWVWGPTLRDVLAMEKVLEVKTSLAMATALADALASVHAAGLVHRDVKPSNIILENGDPTRPVLVDFGTVRGEGLPAVTLVGAPTGTVGYMAPERLSSVDGVAPPTDVWSLGAVLWECLRGERLIEGNSALAMMTRTVVAEPRSVAREGIPPRVAALVDRCLRRDPSARPPNGHALRDELLALERAPTQGQAVPIGLTERTFLCVALVGSTETAAVDRSESERAARDEVLRIARAHGLEASDIDGGVCVLWTTVAQSAPPSTIAWRATRCALAIQSATGARAVIGSGMGEVTRGSPEGEVIEQALALWNMPPAPHGIRVSNFTADLLREETDVAHDADSAIIQSSATLRLVDEKPLLGRTRERRALSSWIERTASHLEPRVMLVHGAPGLGKSRLCDAVLRGVPEGFSSLLAECDASTEQATFRTLRCFVSAAALALVGTDPGALRRSIVAHASSLGLSPERAAFLGELADPRDPDVAPELLGARSDPSTWARTVGVAFGDWLAAWSARQPTVLVIDDLQWSDGPSLVCLQVALAQAADRPIAVLGFARPEVLQMRAAAGFLRSGAERMQLEPLTTHDAVNLLQAASGNALTTRRAEELASVAEGNPMFLLELARADRIASHSPRSLTPVLHMRFQNVEPDVRRLLRAATIFGVVFPLDGCAAASGLERSALDALMHRAAEAELLQTVDATTGRFCHALVRAAAYEMLGPEDRANGHAMAASWLLENRPLDHAAIAMHLEQAGSHREAAEHWLDAARAARATNDLDLTERFASFGRGCCEHSDAPPHVRSGLGVLLAETAGLHHRHVASIELADRALDDAAEGSSEGYDAMAYLARALEAGRDRARVGALIGRFECTTPTSDATNAFVRAGLQLASSMAVSGAPDVARALLPRFTSLLGAVPDASLRAQYETTMMAVDVITLQYGPAMEHARRARDEWARLQSQSQEATSARVLGMLLGQVGDGDAGQAALHHALTIADRRGLPSVRSLGLASLGQLHELAGRFDRALEYRAQAAKEVAASDDRRTHGSILVGLGRVRARVGDWRGARSAAEEGLRLLEGGTRAVRAQLLLAEVELHEGDPAAALHLVLRAWDGLASPQDRDHLTHGFAVAARVFEHIGETARAIEAARAGLDILTRVALSLDDHSNGRPRALRMLAMPAYAELLDLGSDLGLPHPLQGALV